MILGGDLLTLDDAEGLINGSHLPFVVSMTCLNGFYQDVYSDSLAEALLKGKQGGSGMGFFGVDGAG